MLMKALKAAIVVFFTLVSTHTFANDSARVDTVTDGIKEIEVCSKFFDKPDDKSAAGEFESRIKALLYNHVISVPHRNNIKILKLDAEKIQIYEKQNGKQKLIETIKYKKDPISFLSEIDNFERIISNALTAAQKAEADEDHSQDKIDTDVEEDTCALQIVQLIKKEYSKK